ncbi:hypothetical protein E1264_27350 [Actinomadura sp. KC216]|uniref:hypothetical protein n=1 Tax=Actinomadura sp. KC216 TaxID=2530370 RepID=UPI0010428D92|nr:hypothetical protein [Actinomadura sp. KC216]TDB83711.1 hypothetical protein E1264_27350 [Actinomadura sp. KC216]
MTATPAVPVPFPVAWAVLGKEPGSYDDYAITAGGAGLSGRQLPAVFAELSSLGEPPADQAGPRALPWIVFTAVRAGDRDHVGLSVQDWTSQNDGMGRPITACTFYYLPYREASDLGVSYREILAAVRDEPLPEAGSALHATLTRTDRRGQAATVAELGFERVARAAALLLEGPVTVTRAEHLTVEQRLAFMDAVAALLPQGWRTRFSAATWHEGADTRIGLAFAHQCRPGSFELDWQAPGAPPPTAPAAEGYLAWLKELVEVRRWAPSKLLAGLAARDASMFDDEPGAAVAILQDLDWPGTVWRSVRDGTAERDELVRLFTLERHRELDAPDRVSDVFDALVAAAEPDDLPLVAKHWRACRGREETLVRNARRRVWRERPEPGLDAYAETAERLGSADTFLAALLAEPRPPHEAPGGEATLAALLRERRPPAAGPVPAALGGHPALLAELLLAVTADPAADRRAWLAAVSGPAPPVLLDAFRAMWERPARPPGSFAELVALGRGCLPAVLNAATRRRVLGAALASFGGWLMTAADAPDDPAWTALLAGLDPATSADKGTVDGLLVWLGGEPRHFAGCARSPTYFEAFHAVRSEPAGRAGLPRLHRALLGYLGRYEWVTAHAAGAVSLVGDLDTDPAIARTVLLARSVEPALDRVAAYARWRRRILTVHPELHEGEALLLVRNIRPDAPPEVVGELCAEALARGMPVGRIRDQLIATGWRFSGELLVTLVDHVAGHLMRLRHPDPTRMSLALGRSLLKRCPPQQAAEIRRYAFRYAARDARYRLDMIRFLTEDPDKAGKLRLDDADRRDLHDLAEFADHLAHLGHPFWKRL